MPTAPPATASRYQAVSTAAAEAGVRAAHVARPRGIRALWSVIATYQTAQAQLAEQATAAMLSAQHIESAADALLNFSAFTTSLDSFNAMLEQVEQDWQFDQLVNAMVQDAGRTAQSVSVAARPHIGFVRMLTPPSCGRCAVLAGRVYRYSQGFLRHPGCDCTMLPTTLANDRYIHDPDELVKKGVVTGLSKADHKALADGADLAKVVNVRLLSAGLTDSGRVLSRRGRPTPEAIYRAAGDDRDRALELLESNGYLRTIPAKSPVDTGGRGGSGGPPTPPTSESPSDPGDDEGAWRRRQMSLEGPNFTANGETLGPEEILFVERMLALGERLRWIRPGELTDSSGTLPSNDFEWLSLGGLLVEHKSLEETTPVDFRHIARQIRNAMAKNKRRKIVENVIVDVGDRAAPDTLIAELRAFYDSIPTPPARLWLMSHGQLLAVLPHE